MIKKFSHRLNQTGLEVFEELVWPHYERRPQASCLVLSRHLSALKDKVVNCSTTNKELNLFCVNIYGTIYICQHL